MKRNRILSILLAIILVTGLFGAAPTFSARADSAPPPIDPGFLQYVQAHPDDVFAVIVQKTQNNGNKPDPDPEAEVVNGGGKLKKNLNFITSFSA